MNIVSSYPRNAPPQAEVTVKVASSLEELMQVFAIRSAVFMADQKCPYHEEFDGNDFSASHIIAYCDGEPAATIRLRYFSEFAKIERMAVRTEFRGYATVNPLIKYTLNLAQTKGYTKFFLLIRDTPPVGMYVLNMFCMRGSRLWGSRLHRVCVV